MVRLNPGPSGASSRLFLVPNGRPPPISFLISCPEMMFRYGLFALYGVSIWSDVPSATGRHSRLPPSIVALLGPSCPCTPGPRSRGCLRPAYPRRPHSTEHPCTRKGKAAQSLVLSVSVEAPHTERHELRSCMRMKPFQVLAKRQYVCGQLCEGPEALIGHPGT